MTSQWPIGLALAAGAAAALLLAPRTVAPSTKAAVAGPAAPAVPRTEPARDAACPLCHGPTSEREAQNRDSR